MYCMLSFSLETELENPVNYILPHTCHMHSQSQKWYIYCSFTPMVKLKFRKPITWRTLIDILIVVKVVTKISVLRKPED
jgi:hypothetical protein